MKHNNDKPEYQNRPATRGLPKGDKFVPQTGVVHYGDVIDNNSGFTSAVKPGNKLNRQGK